MANQVELLLRTMEDLGDKELRTFQWYLHQADPLPGFPAVPKSYLNGADREGTVDVMVQTYGRQRAVLITGKVLEKMNRNDLAQCLLDTDSAQHALLRPSPAPQQLILSYQRILQSNLQSRYMCVPEGLSKQRDKKHLDDIYTELYVTEGSDVGINCMHEVRHIEITSRKLQGLDKPIMLGDLFNHPSGKYIPIKTVLTTGIAGIGKTFLVYKFMLDWAEGTSSQDVHLMFPFTFRQLNLLKGKTFSLSQLIYACIRETVGIDEKALNEMFTTLQTSGNSNYDKSDYKLLFVLDGLDESRLNLNFANNEDFSVDITKPTTVDELMTNLIKGKLLPSARLWITSRPTAANQISADYIDRVTEVRGFTDQQKEEYFRKRFEDEDLTSRIISHIKKSRSLYIMCHIPVFCWISATVLERALSAGGQEIKPKNLTEMYTHFLVFQIKQTSLKYGEESSLQSIQSLAKLAFDHLEKGTLIFYEGDLKNSSISFSKASFFSGVFTQIFKEESGLHKENMFSFVHLTIQEYLAAVHVVLSQINNNKNALKPQTFQSLRTHFKKITPTDIHIIAVDKAVQSSNGHLDLFLRFLLGLSLETNQILLQGLLKRTDSSSQSKQDIVNYIKKKIRETPCPERNMNLFHCLNELNDHSLIEEIQRYLNTGTLSKIKLPASEWSALAFVLLTSGEKLDVFDLRKYNRSEEGLLKMLPVVKASTTAILSQCELSSQCCKALAFAVTSTATLKELDLGANNLQNSGVKLLSTGLGNPHCRLKTLRLSGCELTEEACVSLGSALNSNHSHLRELDLSYNNLQDVGVQGLLSQLRNLKILRLKSCGLTGEFPNVVSLLSSGTCRLTELDLSGNDLHDRGVKLLSAGLASPHCMLEALMLSGCLIIEEGCASLCSALSSNPAYLRKLDLSYNHPGEKGIAILSAGLEDPLWKLETLCVDYCSESRIQPGPTKYACELTMDLNTAERKILLSEGNRKATVVPTEQPYPPHPERFEKWQQVLCTEGLTGRCYWEVQWSGVVHVGVTYKEIRRQGQDEHSRLGWNNKSWSLNCNKSTAWHNGKGVVLLAFPKSIERLGVYLDWSAGILSFYNVHPGSPIMSHIYTFHVTFTEPLYPGFWLAGHNSSAMLCKVVPIFQIHYQRNSN
ncbi:unnamed protein product [Lota lota]